MYLADWKIRVLKVTQAANIIAMNLYLEHRFQQAKFLSQLSAMVLAYWKHRDYTQAIAADAILEYYLRGYHGKRQVVVVTAH